MIPLVHHNKEGINVLTDLIAKKRNPSQNIAAQHYPKMKVQPIFSKSMKTEFHQLQQLKSLQVLQFLF